MLLRTFGLGEHVRVSNFLLVYGCEFFVRTKVKGLYHNYHSSVRRGFPNVDELLLLFKDEKH